MCAKVGNDFCANRPFTLFLMILACCLLLANLYYSQPILADIALALGISTHLAGSVVTMSQFGYIAGLLFLAPLGDFIENRKLCATMTAGAAIMASSLGFTNNLAIFLCAIFLMGAFASATQILVVFSVTLGGAANSGRILGIMACGIFLGIAASRPVSSFISSLWGWRAVYSLSGLFLFAISLTLYKFIPALAVDKKSFDYFFVLRSMIGLISYRRLLRRSFISGGTFFSFIMFWSAMPMYLSKLGYSQKGITLFTLAGLITPPIMLLVGKLLDKGYNRQIIFSSLCSILAVWLMLGLVPSWLCFFILAALLLDPFSSAVTVSVQQKILTAAPLDMRGRLNSLNISLNFLGGAAGGVVGPWLMVNYGLMAALLTGAFIVSILIIFAIFSERQGA